MSKYKSYSSTNKKLQKLFNRTNENENNIKNNIRKINKSFTSQTNYKSAQQIVISENLEITRTDDMTQVSVDLIGFPDWAINMVRPMIIYSFPSGFDVVNDVDGFAIENQNGTLKLNDVSFIRNNTNYWFVEHDNYYTFTVNFDIDFQYVSSKTEFSFDTSPLPTFAKLKLFILNEKNYDELQSGK
jgi:hypothetical protein